jgi:acyl-homoserine lactone synthase
MIHILHEYELSDRRLATMAEDRKRLFVDLLGWEVPIIAGRYEIDAFDSDLATYLVAVDEAGAHEGSMRLLPTTTPHILADLFPQLCFGAAPRGLEILEITRLCLPSRLGAERRRLVRDQLISAMVDHALENGITSYTGVVTERFLAQILAMGWYCHTLGRPAEVDGSRLGAFRLYIDAETPARLRTTGIYRPGSILPRSTDQAA